MVRQVKPTPEHGRAAQEAADAAVGRRVRYGALPPRPALDELVEEAPTGPPDDPQMGRDSDRDWMLRDG
jgi:hypothetical protein